MRRTSHGSLPNHLFLAIQPLLIVSILYVVVVDRPAPAQTNSAGVERLTGCLDEQTGPQYVLRDQQELRLIALLEPDGFPAQAFAKYLGQEVEVTGSRTTKDGASLIKVRSVKRLAKTCTPAGTGSAPPVSSKLSKEIAASGCLDEEPGPLYALRGDKELKLLMELEPDGFPVQNFARYLGHRVELRGRTYIQNTKTVMKVKSIKSLADTCTPR